MSGRKKLYLCNQGNIHLLNTGKTRIGRHNSNTIVINDIKITRFHAVVYNTGKFLLLEDLNSANGTYINGRILTPRCPKQLFKNDVIIFGNESEEYELFVFRVVEQFEHARSEYKPLTEQEKLRLSNSVSSKKSNTVIANDISLSNDEENVTLNHETECNETLKERKSKEHSNNKMIKAIRQNKKTTEDERSNKCERTGHQKIKKESPLTVGKRKQSSFHSTSDENFFSEDQFDYCEKKDNVKKKARISGNSNVSPIKEEKEPTLSGTSVALSEKNSVNDCTIFAADESAIDADSSFSQRSLYCYTLEDEIIYVDSEDDDIDCLSQRHSFSQQQFENSLSLISEQSNNSLEMMDVDNDMKSDDYMDTETKWFETLMHIDIEAFQTVKAELPSSNENDKIIDLIKREVDDNDDAQMEPVASDSDDHVNTVASDDGDNFTGISSVDVTIAGSTARDDTEKNFTKTDISGTAIAPELNERTLRSRNKKRWTVASSISHVPPVKKHQKTGRGDFLLDVPPLPASVGTGTNMKNKISRPKPVSANVKQNNATTMDVDGIVNTVQRISLHDNITSVTDVAVDTPDTTVNLNVIANKSNKLVAKKSVSFSTSDDIRSIPANAEITVKRSNENVPHRRYEFFEQLIVELAAAFENAIYRICKWNVIWLVQQIDGMPPPPLYPDEGFINEKCGLFTSINAYAEKMKYLLFHEMWYGMLKEWHLRNDMAFPYTQNMTNQNSVLSYGIVQKVCKERTHYRKSVHKVLEPHYFSFPNFWTLSVYRILSEDEYMSNSICNGQLLILNLKVSNEEKGRTMIFAYVCYENRVIINNVDYNISKYDLDICNGHPYAIQYLNIKVPERSFDIIPGSKIKLKPFTLIKAPTTRLFSALSLIENTPVHGALILPQYHNFNIDKHIELDNSIDKFLCPYQKDAVTMCLNMCLSDEPNLCLVDGAAGSGKTQVIVSLISQLFNGSCKLPEDRKLNMLVVTKNEYEADDLVIRISKAKQKYLSKKRCSVVRYGQMSAFSSRIAEYCLDNLVDKLINDNPENILNLSEEINCTRAQINAYKQALQSTKMNNEQKEKITTKLKDSESFLATLKSGNAYKNPHYLQTLKKNAYFSILQSADVVVTTYNSCWSSRSDVYFIPSAFNKGEIVKFDTCVMDDCAQNTEIHGLIAVMFRINHLILVGDSGQLTIPASLLPFPEFERVIKSQNESMYFRFLRCKKSSALINKPDVCILRSQFRMNPVIFQWPNMFFYDSSEHTNTVMNKYDKYIRPYLIISHRYLKDDFGNTNDDEIKLIAMIAESIGAIESLKRLKIAVIVSNRHQVEAARPHMLIAQKIWNNQIIVCTMDDCFGRQYDVVIISMVETECNFPVNDTAWLNRILTRASVSLLICGNFEHLKRNRALGMLVNNAEMRDMLHYIDSPVHRISTDIMRSIILRV